MDTANQQYQPEVTQQPPPKPLAQSKTAWVNIAMIILYPLVRQGVMMLFDRLGIDSSQAGAVADELIKLLPEALAFVPVAAVNLYLRLITHEPVSLRWGRPN